LAVLTTEQKQSGVVVIDCGGGTTDYLVYADNVVAAAGSIGLGGDHITNDIALGFTIPPSRAEVLKKRTGSAVVARSEMDKIITLPPEVGFPGRTISMRALHTVIHARVDETLQLVKKRLVNEGHLYRIGAGIVLTGGGTHLKGITEVAHQIFGLPCVIGRPCHVSGMAAVTEGPEYAACCGMIQYGFKTLAEQESGKAIGGWLRRLFGAG